MSGGYSADIDALREIARKDLPGVCDELQGEALVMFSLERTTDTISGTVDGSSAAFGGVIPEAVALGQKYNGLLDALAHVGIALSESVGTAAQRLSTIADNYQRIDDHVASRGTS
ncbi:MAG TPA: hypothetical protein VJT49_11925 [Amycolatopsis sp.]|uniref:hypothetical protein n=1 Tax=Amycolatopsis sp. TaxID=37632 RepID=UPI002B484CA2|nr:hypothetical protein [Amycolatopsis sp.]HKS45796.1 hypothetical protein [Amycolatopsis sp.]